VFTARYSGAMRLLCAEKTKLLTGLCQLEIGG
jgi:hypothetical protein